MSLSLLTGVSPLPSVTFFFSIAMVVFVNDEKHEFLGRTVADLIAELAMPQKGVAVAIDMDIVPKAEWSVTELHDGQRLMIIKAACGG